MTIVEADGWREEAERLRAELAAANEEIALIRESNRECHCVIERLRSKLVAARAELESARADRDDWEARAREAERQRDLYVALLATADEEDE